MKILIRADGGSRIGMGHVMRMLVLADAMREFSEVAFACKEDEEFHAGVKHIESCGYSVYKVKDKAAVRKLAKTDVNCLITDSYEVDEEYFDSIRDVFAVTGYMDDLNKYRLNVDFIINQNIYAGDMKYHAGIGTKLFLGTQYALLRKEFQKLPRRNAAKEIKNIMITMGGSDPGNLTEAIALELSRAFPEVVFHIVAGLSFTSIDRLKRIAGENIHLHVNPRMSELMLKCDAAITACGSTVYELCACGTPIIGMVTADNQIMLAGKMNSIGAMKYARKPDELIQYMQSLDFVTRVRMSENGRALVDGFGSTRLAGEIRKIIINKA